MVTTPTVWKSREQVNQTGTGSQSDAAIIDIGLGRYVAVWTEAAGGPIAADAGSDLIGQIFDAAGNAIGVEFLVNVLRTFDDEQDVALAPRVGGGFAAVYEDTDGDGTGIVIEFFDVNGVHLSSNDIQFDPGDDTLSNPSVAMNANGSHLITYERSNNTGDTDIVGRVFTEGGVLGNEFLIFDQDDDTTNPQVAALSDGNYVVVYQDEFEGSATDIDVRFKIISPTGTVLDADNAANSVKLEDDPHVAALAGGGFVVVWRDDEGDGTDDPGIKATVYGNDGDPVNNFIAVNTTTAGDQADPEVTALTDGGFVVVWRDNGSLIRGQRFDASGNKVGSEFTENFSVEDDPVVAGLSDGRFIVAFEDVDNAPGDIDIHATIFDPRTSPINGTGNADVLTSRKDGARVNGLGGTDTLLGQEGADILDGGTGADLMLGRGGDDIYFVDNAGDAVVEVVGQGTDTVGSSVSFTLGANVENLGLIGSANINGTGNALANTIVGNEGNNRIDGKGGADIMQGGVGDDVYIVDNAGDVVVEGAGQGTDSVGASVSFTLGANLENLVLTGGGNINGTGNALANTILGNAGNNTLNGGGGDDALDGRAGADAMNGGSGNDTYFVDNAGDTVTEGAGEGTDTVASSIAFALGDDVENLVLTGSAKINATGNKLANIVVGNTGKNTLDGGKGADLISGGIGKDKLLGKGGKDMFVFADAIVAGNADKLKDFKHKKDKLLLDPDLYAAVGPKVSKKEFVEGKKAGDADDHLIRNKKNIYYDIDGKGGAKQVLIAKIDKKMDLDHKDFMVGDLVI